MHSRPRVRFEGRFRTLGRDTAGARRDRGGARDPGRRIHLASSRCAADPAAGHPHRRRRHRHDRARRGHDRQRGGRSRKRVRDRPRAGARPQARRSGSGSSKFRSRGSSPPARSRSTSPSRTSRSRAKRAKSVDFSSPYFVVNKGVLVAPGVAPPTSLADLRKLRICAQAGTTSIEYVLTKLRPVPAPHSFPSPIDALRALSDDYCQAMIADLEILVAAKRDQPDLYGSIAGQIVTNEHYGAVFEKGSKLRAPINAALQSLARSGAVTRLATRGSEANGTGARPPVEMRPSVEAATRPTRAPQRARSDRVGRPPDASARSRAAKRRRRPRRRAS